MIDKVFVLTYYIRSLFFNFKYMALKDLIINNAEVSEEILNKILSGNINLVSEGNSVILTQGGNKFSTRERVLLYLCGKKAWGLLEKKEFLTLVGELEKNLGIKGNTLRPILKSLKDSYKVDSQKGKYSILPQGIFDLNNAIDGTKVLSDGSENKHPSSYKKNGAKKKKNPSITDFLIKFRDDGFFNEGKNINEILTRFSQKGITSLKLSSLPSYLLPLVLNDVLVRSKQNTKSGKGKIWVYSKK